MKGIVQRLLHGGAPNTAAVILAAGLGTRMQSSTEKTKQLRTLLSVPVVVHSLRAFEACPEISEIVLVARAEELEVMQTLVSKYGIKKLSRIVVGGKTRQASAKNGFLAIGKKAKYVAIHDAARCLILPSQIGNVVTAAWTHRAATAAAVMEDTVKLATKEGFIERTVPRETVFAAQTPQVFDCDLYAAALYTAEKRGDVVTDDNMLLENITQAIKLVDCGKNNFKITTEEDILRAAALLQQRGDTYDT